MVEISLENSEAPLTASSAPLAWPLSLTEISQVDGLTPVLDEWCDSEPRFDPKHGDEPEPGVEPAPEP